MRQGRRVSGCIRTGTHEAAARLAAAEQASPDAGGPADGGPDHTSVRRINALLEQAGAIECRLVEDDEHQARGTDIRLLELPRPSPEALARAEATLERWTRERGDGWLAGVDAYRAKATALRRRRPERTAAKVPLPAGFLQRRNR